MSKTEQWKEKDDFVYTKKAIVVHDKCKSECEYSTKHDEYYCKACDEWASDGCGESDCCYCGNRPEKPSEITA